MSHEVEEGIATTLKECLSFLSDLVTIAHSIDFDEATFQVYLSLGKCMLTGLGSSVRLKDLVDSVKKGLDSFVPFWQLHSGQSMELIWNHFKPPVPASLEQLEQNMQVEKLAERFDALMWTLDVPLERLGGIRHMVAQIRGATDVSADGLTNSVVVRHVHSV